MMRKWLVQIERLARADSDFSAFLHHAGVSSVDMYFGKGMAFPVKLDGNEN